MSTVSRRPASSPRQLTRVGDRLSFVYLERCVVHRDANAITAEDADGVTHIPSATIGTLLLGPGTRITHQAMAVLGESGAVVVWVGEHGVRFYAGGRALSRSSALVEAQAKQAAEQPLPPLDQLPPDMVRAGYAMQRQSQDQNAPKDVAARDFAIPGPHGDIPVRFYTPAGVAMASLRLDRAENPDRTLPDGRPWQPAWPTWMGSALRS